MSPALFLLPIALAISGLLWFRMKCEFSISEKKKCRWEFDRDCDESVDYFG